MKERRKRVGKERNRRRGPKGEVESGRGGDNEAERTGSGEKSKKIKEGIGRRKRSALRQRGTGARVDHLCFLVCSVAFVSPGLKSSSPKACGDKFNEPGHFLSALTNRVQHVPSNLWLCNGCPVFS